VKDVLIVLGNVIHVQTLDVFWIVIFVLMTGTAKANGLNVPIVSIRIVALLQLKVSIAFPNGIIVFARN
jgi:hypothetical protein